MLVFPREIETHISAVDGVIYFEQFDANGNRVGMVGLTVHQFEEIFNREKSVIAEAREKLEEEE